MLRLCVQYNKHTNSYVHTNHTSHGHRCTLTTHNIMKDFILCSLPSAGKSMKMEIALFRPNKYQIEREGGGGGGGRERGSSVTSFPLGYYQCPYRCPKYLSPAVMDDL